MRIIATFFIVLMVAGCTQKSIRTPIKEVEEKPQYTDLKVSLPADADKSESSLPLQAVYVSSGTYLTKTGEINVLPNAKKQSEKAWQGGARPATPNERAESAKLKKVIITLPE